MPSPARTRRRVHVTRRRAFGVLLALAACNAPIDYATKRCDADHACPSGWTCAASGYCLEIGPPNTVQNGSFESGTTGWKVLNGTLETTDGGLNSPTAGVWKPIGGTAASVLTSVSPSVTGSEFEWYCARAWILGNDGKDLELQLLENGEPGGSATVEATGDTWKQLKASTLSTGDGLSIALVSSASSGPRTLLVDDLALWKSIGSANCDKAP
jgi:hypothetical protein